MSVPTESTDAGRPIEVEAPKAPAPSTSVKASAQPPEKQVVKVEPKETSPPAELSPAEESQPDPLLDALRGAQAVDCKSALDNLEKKAKAIGTEKVKFTNGVKTFGTETFLVVPNAGMFEERAFQGLVGLWASVTGGKVVVNPDQDPNLTFKNMVDDSIYTGLVHGLNSIQYQLPSTKASSGFGIGARAAWCIALEGALHSVPAGDTLEDLSVFLKRDKNEEYFLPTGRKQSSSNVLVSLVTDKIETGDSLPVINLIRQIVVDIVKGKIVWDALRARKISLETVLQNWLIPVQEYLTTLYRKYSKTEGKGKKAKKTEVRKAPHVPKQSKVLGDAEFRIVQTCSNIRRSARDNVPSNQTEFIESILTHGGKATRGRIKSILADAYELQDSYGMLLNARLRDIRKHNESLRNAGRDKVEGLHLTAAYNADKAALKSNLVAFVKGVLTETQQAALLQTSIINGAKAGSVADLCAAATSTLETKDKLQLFTKADLDAIMALGLDLKKLRGAAYTSITKLKGIAIEMDRAATANREITKSDFDRYAVAVKPASEAIRAYGKLVLKSFISHADSPRITKDYSHLATCFNTAVLEVLALASEESNDVFDKIHATVKITDLKNELADAIVEQAMSQTWTADAVKQSQFEKELSASIKRLKAGESVHFGNLTIKKSKATKNRFAALQK